MKASDFLPSFFRPRKRDGVIIGPGRNDGLPNIFGPGNMDSQGGIWENGLPATQPHVRMDADPSPALVSMPNIATAPSGVGEVSDVMTHAPVDIADIPRVSGHVYTDPRGRPKPFSSELDPESAEKTIAVNQAIENYDPAAKPAEGWRKWVPTMVSGALRGFGAGGVGGAIFGATEGGIGGALDPSRVNREWQNRELARRAPGVAGVYRDQAQRIKTARDIAAIGASEAAADLARKRAGEVGKAKPGQVKENERGEWVVVDPVTKTTSPVIDPSTGLPAKTKPTGAKEEWIHDELGVAHKYKDGKDTGLTDPGRKLNMIPGYGLVSPGEKYRADRIDERETGAAVERGQIASGEARSLLGQATTLEGNASIWESRADDIEGEIKAIPTDEDGEYSEAAKAQLQAKTAEVARLRSEARDARNRSVQLKADAAQAESKSKAAGGRATGRKYKVDPKYLQ